MDLKSNLNHKFNSTIKKLQKDKKGVMGLSVAKSFLMILLGLVVLGVTFMIVLNELGSTAIVANDPATQSIIGNATEGAASFFSNTGTWLALLSVVILILIIAVVIVVVNRFGSGGGRSL